MEDRIIFRGDDGDEAELCVIEQTTINGRSYLLVAEDTEDGEDEAVAYIMREKTVEDDDYSEDTVYEIVEDERELEAVAGVFKELVEDCDISME